MCTSTRRPTPAIGIRPNWSATCAGHGRTKVLFGTNYPMITARAALARLDELGLDDQARDLFLHANAERLFSF